MTKKELLGCNTVQCIKILARRLQCQTNLLAALCGRLGQVLQESQMQGLGDELRTERATVPVIHGQKCAGLLLCTANKPSITTLPQLLQVPSPFCVTCRKVPEVHIDMTACHQRLPCWVQVVDRHLQRLGSFRQVRDLHVPIFLLRPPALPRLQSVSECLQTA